MSHSKTNSTRATLSIFYGAVINPKSLTRYEKLPRALIIANHGGASSTHWSRTYWLVWSRSSPLGSRCSSG
ncbi:hypothetical protein ACEPAG_5164 [Sanghuangporus baumii]